MRKMVEQKWDNPRRKTGKNEECKRVVKEK